MNLYRGCKESGIKVMYPRLVNHKMPYVYASTDKIEALLYSVKGGNFNYTNIYGYDDNNKRCLIERKEGVLEKIYNKEGRYYILDSKDFQKHKVLGTGEFEYVSKKPVNVISEVKVPNIYEYLKDLERKGLLKIYRYPSRPKIYPKDDSDLIECAIIMYLETNDIEKSFGLLEKYHPELSDDINEKILYIKKHTKEEIRKEIKLFK